MSMWRQLGCGCVLAAVLSAAVVARADEQEPTERARAILKLLTERKYGEFVATGDATVRAGFSAEQAAQVWAGLQLKLGPYQAEQSIKTSKLEGHDLVDIVCRFERGTCTLRVTLDAQRSMAGFFCMAVNPTLSYEPPDYVDQDSFSEERVTVSAGEFPLAGTLTLPAKKGPHPALVLVHGSGPHDEDETVGANKPFRDLAWGLASRGVAVLRYVKRTKAHPLAKKAAEWTLAAETIDDAVAAAQLLREHAAIDARRVFVAGHSLGGMAAPFIAQRDEQLAGIIIMAGNARSILDLLEEQTEYIARLDGQYNAEERAAVEKLKDAVALIRAGRVGEITEPVLGVPAAYWSHLHSLDQVGAAAKLKLPILILQGGRDYQVTPADFELWKKRIGQRQNVEMKLYNKLNHLFIAGEGKPTPEDYQQSGHVSAQVITDIAEWIKAH